MFDHLLNHYFNMDICAIILETPKKTDRGGGRKRGDRFEEQNHNTGKLQRRSARPRSIAREALPGYEVRCRRLHFPAGPFWGLVRWRFVYTESLKFYRYERGSIEMSHDFDNKKVGLVATIIGVTVLSLGILGLLSNLG